MQYGAWKRPPFEKKSIDTSITNEFNSAGTTANSAVLLLNSVAQSSDYLGRIGREIWMKSIYLQGEAVQNNSPESQTVRVAIVYDTQPNGVSAASLDIFNIPAGAANNPTTPVNLNNRDRFKILYDKRRELQVNGGTNTATCNVAYFKKYIKCSLKVTFGATTAGIGSIISGALWLVTIGWNAAAAADAAKFNGQCRVRFIDP